VSQRNSRYRDHALSSTGDTPPRVDRRALAIFEDASKLVGVDEPKREIVELLTGCDSTKQQPKLVSIVGFGGLGKTTIANQVYQELRGQFDCHAFFSMSRNPDITTVVSNLYRKLDPKYYPGTEDLQTLITKILDFLANKRYCFILLYFQLFILTFIHLAIH
jgi:disease resistance protein RPM1